jgi:hypothetical protein
MSSDRMLTKLQSFAHTEFDTPQFANVDSIRRAVERGEDLFKRPNIQFELLSLAEARQPRYVHEHPERFQDWLLEPRP